MISFFETIISIFANILAIFGLHADTKKLSAKCKNKKFLSISSIVVLFIIIICLIAHKQLSITVTQVILNEYSLIMSTGDNRALAATVIYSDNSMHDSVVWTSSNQSVATINSNGQITALAEGTTTIIAQATKNNTTASAECTVTVKNPPSGYSISVRQISAGSCYAYVYVKPYDDNVTKLQIYGKSPSGRVFTPDTDKYDLYHFYAEYGIWTIYASLENEAGIYEAHKPEDFVTIEVTNIPSNLLNDIFSN